MTFTFSNQPHQLKPVKIYYKITLNIDMFILVYCIGETRFHVNTIFNLIKF